MSSYQILACHGGSGSKEQIYNELKSKTGNYVEEVIRFDVPETLKFGSFDSLIKMMDDLSKQDTSIESILRRIERQMIELEPTCEFKVLFRQKTMTVDQYVRSFQWDDTKFPRTRSLMENLSQLTGTIARVDEDVKTKAYAFSDVKSTIQNLNKMRGPQVTFQNAELVDVLTPEVVSADDFVNKEHLTTVLVSVPKGGDKDFLACYEKADKYVVPRSAKQFMKLNKSGGLAPLEDKDGSTLYRVICFKGASIEALRKCVREVKCSLREFTYAPTAFKELVQKAEELNSEYTKHELSLKRHCAAAFSDTVSAFLHLKAMRVFVESTLRYGVPANFAAFIVRPTSVKNLGNLRTALTDVFSQSNMFGKSYLGGGEGEGEEAYYPYVNLAFAPLTPAVAA